MLARPKFTYVTLLAEVNFAEPTILLLWVLHFNQLNYKPTAHSPQPTGWLSALSSIRVNRLVEGKPAIFPKFSQWKQTLYIQTLGLVLHWYISLISSNNLQSSVKASQVLIIYTVVKIVAYESMPSRFNHSFEIWKGFIFSNLHGLLFIYLFLCQNVQSSLYIILKWNAGIKWYR